MNLSTLHKLSGWSFITGASLLVIYSVAFFACLPMASLNDNFAALVSDPDWLWIVCSAFFGILLMLPGYTAIYSVTFRSGGWAGLTGYVLIVFANLLQMCQVTWEVFIYPILAHHTETAFLLSDHVIETDPGIAVFFWTSSLSILIGIILFCRMVARSGHFGKAGAWGMAGGAILYGIGPFLTVYVAIGGIVLFAAGAICLANNLIRNIPSGV